MAEAVGDDDEDTIDDFDDDHLYAAIKHGRVDVVRLQLETPFERVTAIVATMRQLVSDVSTAFV